MPFHLDKWISRKNSLHLYEKIQGFEGVFWRMIYNLFTEYKFMAICLNGSAKKLSSPISKKTGVWGGVWENDLQFVYKSGWYKTFSSSPISIKMAVWHPSKKTFLTYMNKNGLLNTLFWKMFTDCLQTPSLNSHRKPQAAPPSKKYLSPIWIFVGVLATFFRWL